MQEMQGRKRQRKDVLVRRAAAARAEVAEAISLLLTGITALEYSDSETLTPAGQSLLRYAVPQSVAPSGPHRLGTDYCQGLRDKNPVSERGSTTSLNTLPR